MTARRQAATSQVMRGASDSHHPRGIALARRTQRGRHGQPHAFRRAMSSTSTDNASIVLNRRGEELQLSRVIFGSDHRLHQLSQHRVSDRSLTVASERRTSTLPAVEREFVSSLLVDRCTAVRRATADSGLSAPGRRRVRLRPPIPRPTRRTASSSPRSRLGDFAGPELPRGIGYTSGQVARPSQGMRHRQ